MGAWMLPDWKTMLCRLPYSSTALIMAGVFGACATAAPTRLDLQDLAVNPRAHKNERIEVTGHVVDYEPARGNAYRTLYFTLGLEPDGKIAVFSSGYTADAIAKASALVREAFEAREPLTVVGKLKIDEKAEAEPVAELRLESVEYGGRKVRVNRGRRTRSGMSVGGWYFRPSIGIGATFSP